MKSNTHSSPHSTFRSVEIYKGIKFYFQKERLKTRSVLLSTSSPHSFIYLAECICGLSYSSKKRSRKCDEKIFESAPAHIYTGTKIITRWCYSPRLHTPELTHHGIHHYSCNPTRFSNYLLILRSSTIFTFLSSYRVF